MSLINNTLNLVNNTLNTLTTISHVYNDYINKNIIKYIHENIIKIILFMYIIYAIFSIILLLQCVTHICINIMNYLKKEINYTQNTYINVDSDTNSDSDSNSNSYSDSDSNSDISELDYDTNISKHANVFVRINDAHTNHATRYVSTYNIRTRNKKQKFM